MSLRLGRSLWLVWLVGERASSERRRPHFEIASRARKSTSVTRGPAHAAHGMAVLSTPAVLWVRGWAATFVFSSH